MNDMDIPCADNISLLPKNEHIKIKSELKKILTSERYAHTLSVYSECKKLSSLFPLTNEEKRNLGNAALLHDITKCYDGKKQIDLCREMGIPYPERASDPMPTLHQDTGGYYARKLFGSDTVNDGVYSAISCHTTAKCGMNTVDKLLFIADYIEPTRKYKSCSDMREYLYRECGKINKNDVAARLYFLDTVVIAIIEFNLSFLVQKHRKVDVRMVDAWNYMLGNRVFV